MNPDLLIVGAGLAGLCAARTAIQSGLHVQILEATDRPGGRLRTDDVDGFRLDRGFQVLLTAYPEAQRVLDYAALDLRAFESGATVFVDGRFVEVADPLRHPQRLVATALAPVGSLADKLRVLRLRQRVTRGAFEDVFNGDEASILTTLRAEYGFSERMIDRFFRPFFGGIVLDRDLGSSRRMFDFVYRMLVEGQTAIPAAGIDAIPRQLAGALPEPTIRYHAPVASVDASGATLQSGERVGARAVIVATDGCVAADLVPSVPKPASRSVACVYFDAPEPPSERAALWLDGVGSGPVNNLCVPSNLSSKLAPDGRALVSATVLGTPSTDDDALDAAVRTQLRQWFGTQVDAWRRLSVARIHHAQPGQAPPTLERIARRTTFDGVWVAGDHRDTASIQGAMVSGRRVAEDVVRSLHAE
jgi:phytoene dehydrogenase-like protein